jgi:hypothetical protein
MKKLLSLVLAITFIATLVVSTTSSNAQTKTNVTTAVVVAAIAGAGLVGSGSRKAAMVKALRAAYPTNPVIADDQIRMEVYLRSGEGSYKFSLKETGNSGKTERRLNDQDAFRVMEYGLFLMKESTTVPGIGVLETYPNPTSFAAESIFKPEHLEHVYGGHLEIKVGDTLWGTGVPVQGCRVVNTGQQQNATTRSETRSGDGFIDATPQYTFKGSENNAIELKVPADVAQKIESDFATSGYKTKLVLILKGFKVTGAGSVTPAAVRGTDYE